MKLIKSNLVFFLLITFLFSFVFYSSYKSSIAYIEIPFPKLMQEIRDKNVQELTFSGNRISGKYKEPVDNKTNFISFGEKTSDYFLKEMSDNGVVPTFVNPDTTASKLLSSLPMILIIGLFIYMIYVSSIRGKGVMNPPIKRLEYSDVKFSDVSGMNESKDDLVEIVDFLKDPKKYTKLGAKIPKGALLVGPPGTGKTMLAKATASESGVPFFSTSGSEFVEMYVGVGAGRVRATFEAARKVAPCIIFIDEIDAVARKRGGHSSNSEVEQTLNQLLVEMDSVDERNNGIIVLAATNRVEILDDALLRPGRFDRKIYVSLPNLEERENILKLHSKNKTLSKDVDLLQIAKGSAGMSGADLSNLLNEAAILTAKENKEEIDSKTLERAKDKLLLGSERKLILTPEEKRKTAYHEVGHALVGKLLNFNKVNKISIIPRGRALGVTHFEQDENQVSLTPEKAEDYVCTLLAGRAAEELIYGKVTSGASDDIQRATNIIRRMITEWGFDAELGPVNLNIVDERGIPLFGEKTKEKIDSLIISKLNEIYKRTLELLVNNVTSLERITAELVIKEVLTGSEMDELI